MTKVLYIDARMNGSDSEKIEVKDNKLLFTNRGFSVDVADNPSVLENIDTEYPRKVINLGEKGTSFCLRKSVEQADFSKLTGIVILTSNNKADAKLIKGKKTISGNEIEFQPLDELQKKACPSPINTRPEKNHNYGSRRSAILQP